MNNRAKNVAEALIYAVECDIATLEGYRFIKKFSKADIRRAEDIVRTGLANCKRFTTIEDAEAVKASRVTAWFRGETNETGEKP